MYFWLFGVFYFQLFLTNFDYLFFNFCLIFGILSSFWTVFAFIKLTKCLNEFLTFFNRVPLYFLTWCKISWWMDERMDGWKGVVIWLVSHETNYIVPYWSATETGWRDSSLFIVKPPSSGHLGDLGLVSATQRCPLLRGFGNYQS